MSLVATVRHLIIGQLRWLIATGDERDAEILALGHQVLVLRRQINRVALTRVEQHDVGVIRRGLVE